MSTPTATQLHAADASVTVLSNTASVSDWSRRYFGPWWNAFEVPAESICAGPLVVADVDSSAYVELAALVDVCPHEKVTYAKAKTLLARDGAGTVTAISPAEGLAYRSEPGSGWLTIAGRAAEPVALAAARIAREMIRATLLRDGWTLLHSSAVVRDGKTLLTFGSKGAGKTTTALLLASHGFELLANDRVFVRPDGGGELQVLPWPSAAAIGLGLLDALGLYDVVRDRLKAGEHLHPTQHQDVTDALLDGRREPLWEPGGKRERKAQVFPDQFTTWFGMTLATGGRAAGLLFPRIDPAAVPALVDGDRALGEDDFMSGATEDRYPDIFGLAQGIDGGGNKPARATVADRLAQLPHHQVVLGHDTAANADFLTELADHL
ncbi:hypothetical protein [Streptomyces acidiscabies]|uniref:HPr kinase/phosphorylase n=1 Tax=Streptomyces acidiscabies TaxID=42234 RepID=A0AAP6BJB3_9ACTN|nr:hypothetical protein [Streptomyces acidiscabies]MBP5938670.1 hypothetical protein [Streptomyces sp. LBUM 1476]MBZ3909775.1 hypothetical protein [Streptomyces acidiscabies]MDX2965803.1 hypothetical protein [Streptomyces acidiscabies]MDX3025235.1 hypothetical protein [Streptomyces acidiscabies]MDX3795639.1 hypothetical protein [Streptomyces acidiscabies]